MIKDLGFADLDEPLEVDGGIVVEVDAMRCGGEVGRTQQTGR